MEETHRNMSLCERIISTILTENNIIFEHEKSINTKNDRKQRIDFYFELNSQRYAIEYHGEQHFKQATGSWRTPLKRIQELDIMKEKYCFENNIRLLVIKHPTRSKKDIHKIIERFLGVELKYTENVYFVYKKFNSIEDLKNFYLKHDIIETSNHFNLTIEQTKNILKDNGITKRDIPVVGVNIHTLEEVRFDSIKEACEFIGSSGVRSCLTGDRKTCKGFIWRYEDKDFSQNAMKITDKRIKVYRAMKLDETYTLPLQMLSKVINVDKPSIVDASRSNVKRPKGYTITEVTQEEREQVLSEISYLEYIKCSK